MNNTRKGDNGLIALSHRSPSPAGNGLPWARAGEGQGVYQHEQLFLRRRSAHGQCGKASGARRGRSDQKGASIAEETCRNVWYDNQKEGLLVKKNNCHVWLRASMFYRSRGVVEMGSRLLPFSEMVKLPGFLLVLIFRVSLPVVL